MGGPRTVIESPSPKDTRGAPAAEVATLWEKGWFTGMPNSEAKTGSADLFQWSNLDSEDRLGGSDTLDQTLRISRRGPLEACDGEAVEKGSFCARPEQVDLRPQRGDLLHVGGRGAQH